MILCKIFSCNINLKQNEYSAFENKIVHVINSRNIALEILPGCQRDADGDADFFYENRSVKYDKLDLTIKYFR